MQLLREFDRGRFGCRLVSVQFPPHTTDLRGKDSAHFRRRVAVVSTETGAMATAHVILLLSDDDDVGPTGLSIFAADCAQPTTILLFIEPSSFFNK